MPRAREAAMRARQHFNFAGCVAKPILFGSYSFSTATLANADAPGTMATHALVLRPSRALALVLTGPCRCGMH